MDWIDRYAYNNRLRFIHPGQKAGLALLAMLLCLVLNSVPVGLVTVLWMIALAVVWAGLPPRIIVRAVLAEGLFLAWAVAGVAISVHAGSGNGWPLAFSVTQASADAAWQLFARALGCATAMAFLAFTTPLVDLIDLGRKIGVPPLLLDLATLIYRFTFTLFDSLERMVTAQEARLGYASFRRSMNSAAQVAARLFIETYQRSQRLQLALEARGYDGTLRVLPTAYQRSRQAWLCAAALSGSLLLAWGLA